MADNAELIIIAGLMLLVLAALLIIAGLVLTRQALAAVLLAVEELSATRFGARLPAPPATPPGRGHHPDGAGPAPPPT